MRRFTQPVEQASVNSGHYFLGIGMVLFCFILVGSVLFSLVSGWVPDYESSKNKTLALSLLPFLVGVLAIYVVVRLLLKRSFLSLLTARSTFDWKRFFVGFTTWFGFLAIALAVSFWWNSSNFSWNFHAARFFPLLVVVLVLIPVQTLFEELFFRSLLMQLLGKWMNQGIWICIISGVIFGLFHGLNPEIGMLGVGALIFYVISGIFISMLATLDNGLELPWGFHLANNIFNLLIVSTDWQVLQTDALFIDHSAPALGVDFIVTIGVFYPLLLLIFHRIFHWPNWKTTLFNLRRI